MSPLFRTTFRPIIVFLGVYLLLHILLALVHADTVRLPWLWTGGAVVVALWTLLVYLTYGSRPWINATAILALGCGIWTVVVGLPVERLGEYANWWPGAAAVLISLFVLFGRYLTAGITWVFALFLAIAAARMRGLGVDEALAYALPAALVPGIWSTAVAFVLASIGRLSDRLVDLRGLTVRQEQAAAQSRRARLQREQDVETMRAESQALLQEIVETPAEAAVTEDQRRRWRLGALTLRDELAARRLLDDALRDAVHAARERGAVLELQDGSPEEGRPGDEAQRIMLSAAQAVGPGESLSLRRAPGGGDLSVLYMGQGAEDWNSSLGELSENAERMGTPDFVHLIYKVDTRHQEEVADR